MRLKTRELLAFALLSVPLSMGGLPLGLYLTPYYSAELGLSLTAIGVVMLVTRISDVITDPLIGALSDRTPKRFGRRSLWIMIGLPIMGLSTIAVFDPPHGVGWVYLLFAVAMLYFGWTLISIPLAAWAAEISPDYHERSRITGARSIAGTSGTLLVLLLPVLMGALAAHGFEQLRPEHEGSLQPMLRVVAWGTLAMLCVCGPYLFFTVPQADFVQKSTLDLRLALKLVVQNKPFMRLMMSGVMSSIGWYCIGTLYVFFLSYYLGATTQQWSALLIVYLVCSLIGTPVIVRISQNYNKHRMLAAMSSFALVIFCTVLFMRPGDWKYYVFIQIFAGLVANAGAILVPSMAADVIDQDTIESGQQRGALFMALWGTADKLALALAAGLTLPLLEFLGFNPSVENDMAGLNALKYCYAVIPLICLSISVMFIWDFPITRERQEETRAIIQADEYRVD